MNWTAGILAFVLIYIPMAIVFYRFHKQSKKIDRKYEQRMEQIKKKYGVNS